MDVWLLDFFVPSLFDGNFACFELEIGNLVLFYFCNFLLCFVIVMSAAAVAAVSASQPS
jgi:hypothetical protein